jgi:hypothetical protein
MQKVLFMKIFLMIFLFFFMVGVGGCASVKPVDSDTASVRDAKVGFMKSVQLRVGVDVKGKESESDKFLYVFEGLRNE